MNTDNEKTGWIKLHRQFLKWEWYDDINTKIFFLHCILRANHSPRKWRGIQIERGQFYTSLETLSLETGLSQRQVRTCLDKLKTTGELTSLAMSRGRMVTVKNYHDYQLDDRLGVSRASATCQGSDRVATANKNEKNEKNEKKQELPFPSEKFKTTWEEWLIYLKQKRKTPTLLTQQKQLKFLEPMGEIKAIESVNRSIQNGWQGLFEPKDEAEMKTQAEKIRAQNMKKLC